MTKRIPCLVSMESIKYGRDWFEYETMKEAYEGLSRLVIKCLELNDGIERTFSVEFKVE